MSYSTLGYNCTTKTIALTSNAKFLSPDDSIYFNHIRKTQTETNKVDDETKDEIVEKVDDNGKEKFNKIVPKAIPINK